MPAPRNLQEADKGFYINDGDKDLEPIWIPLPEQPYRPTKIINRKKEAKDQKFEYEKQPEALTRLMKHLAREKRRNQGEDSVLTLEDVWDYISENKARYEDEIYWIKSQWYYRLNGKWFYINGKPYHISGWHWFYLNYYMLTDGVLPDFRYSDWRWFNACEYLFNYTLDENKKDVGRLTILGVNYQDGRRMGKTSKVASIHLDLSTRSKNFNGGIQGMDENNGRTVFKKHMVYQYRMLPFFFKPLTRGSTDPAKVLEFRPQEVRMGSKGSVIEDKVGLETQVNYATTSSEGFYDKERMNFIHVDEPGKTKQDVNSRHQVLKECVAKGSGMVRIGFLMYTTTVEETTPEAMDSYRKVVDGSHINKMKNGSTITGMVNIFLPSHKNLEGYIDKYGFCDNEKALEKIMTTREEFRKIGDFDGLSRYIRKFPVKFRECFTPNAEDVNFDREILEKRILELQFEERNAVIRGNFKRINASNPDSEVIFEADADGRFYTSLTNIEKYGYKKNSYITIKGERHPANPMFMASADAFRFNKTKSKSKRISDGGGAVFWMHDEHLDPPSKEIKDYISNRFVLTYQYRPRGNSEMTPKKEYAEDMLMMCEYFGAYMYPERNISDIEDHFIERRRSGYLYHDFNIVLGKIVYNEHPGFDTNERSKDELFKGMESYIKIHGARDKHEELLTDCLNIGGLEEMTNYDRLTAAMGCLKGLKSKYKDLKKPKKKVKATMGAVYGNNLN